MGDVVSASWHREREGFRIHLMIIIVLFLASRCPREQPAIDDS